MKDYVFYWMKTLAIFNAFLKRVLEIHDQGICQYRSSFFFHLGHYDIKFSTYKVTLLTLSQNWFSNL